MQVGVRQVEPVVMAARLIGWRDLATGEHLNVNLVLAEAPMVFRGPGEELVLEGGSPAARRMLLDALEEWGGAHNIVSLDESGSPEARPGTAVVPTGDAVAFAQEDSERNFKASVPELEEDEGDEALADEL